MAQGPPTSSRRGPGLQLWLSKYGVVGRLVLELEELPPFNSQLIKYQAGTSVYQDYFFVSVPTKHFMVFQRTIRPGLTQELRKLLTS